MAEDDPVARKLLETTLAAWRYEPVVAHDGEEAWGILQQQPAPQLAVLDWMMPGLDGPEVCRRARSLQHTRRLYVIMLTSLERKQDLVTALEAGADDYVVKPFDPAELKARIEVGERVLHLQDELASRVSELEKALRDIKMLHGLLPICSYCKKVRNDQDYWQQVESYIESHAEVQFSHGVCPDCYERVVKPHLG
jgi:DNA-binding response OmpR family regulator